MTTTKKMINLSLVFLLIAMPALAEEIHDVALKGDLAKIKTLLDKNPKLIDARSENEKTPLHFAAQGGHREIVEFLIAKGADVNSENISMETPLHYAAAMGYKEVVNLLIARGAVLNSGTLDGSTPLHYAANLGNSEIARVLIEKGADVNCRNKNGLTPLDLAYESGQSEVVQLLVSKGGSYTPVEDPEVFRLSDNVYRIVFPYGDRSNIGVSIGSDGILLIDTGFSKRAIEKLETALNKLQDSDIKCIINTHQHQDHAAGNSIGSDSSAVIGHHNLEKMVSEGIISQPEGSIKGKTGKAFKIHYTMNFNGEEIKIIPYTGVHSDTDLIIYLTDSGVVHMGDLLLSQSFPSVGENVVEYLELLEKIIDTFPADTIFISGHGKDYTTEDVVNYQGMLLATIEIVRNHMKAGKGVKEMRREDVLKDYDTWGTFIVFLNTDYWIGAVYNSYKKNK